MYNHCFIGHLSLPVINKLLELSWVVHLTTGRSPTHILQWRPQSQANAPGETESEQQGEGQHELQRQRNSVLCTEFRWW